MHAALLVLAIFAAPTADHSFLGSPAPLLAQHGIDDEHAAMDDFDLPRQSRLHWIIQSLGLYALLLPATGLAVFVGACGVMFCRPAVAASYLVVLPLPTFIGVFAAASGVMSALAVIGMASIAPKPSEWAEGLATAIVSIVVAMLVNAPAYFVMAFGLPLKTFLASGKP